MRESEKVCSCPVQLAVQLFISSRVSEIDQWSNLVHHWRHLRPLPIPSRHRYRLHPHVRVFYPFRPLHRLTPTPVVSPGLTLQLLPLVVSGVPTLLLFLAPSPSSPLFPSSPTILHSAIFASQGLLCLFSLSPSLLVSASPLGFFLGGRSSVSSCPLLHSLFRCSLFVFFSFLSFDCTNVEQS